jgi:serine/threonine protein kinase
MRKPLFQGSNNINQLMIIIKYLGEPKIDFSRRCQSQPIAEFFKTLNHVMVDEEIACVNNLLRPNFRPFAFDLIRKMLQWDPVDRIDAVSALLHPYFKHPDLKTKEVDKQMEHIIDSTSFQDNFKFERSDSAVTLKQELIKEIAYYDSRDNKINSASSALSSFYYDSTKPISPVKGDPMAPLESISNEPRHDDGPSQGSQPAPAPLDTSNGFPRNLRAEKSTGTTSIGAGGGETSSKICTFKPFNVADFDSMPALHH